MAQEARAAAKVFGNFELLENILLKTIEFDKSDAVRVHVIDSLHDRSTHLQKFYRLQRVNSTFRDVMASSKELRRVMFQDLESIEKKTSFDLRYDFNPLLSRLAHFLPFRLIRFESSGIDNTGARILRVRVVGNGWIEEVSDVAPWRKMLVSRQPMPFSLKIDVYMRGTTTEYTSQLPSGATLGALTDVLVGKVKTEQCCRVKREGVGFKKVLESRRGRKL